MRPRSAWLAALVLTVSTVAAAWLWTPDLDRASLEAAYLDAPTDMVDVAGARLHVRDRGPRDAPAIVLLHGFGASLHTWDPWAASLTGRFRVIRLDLPGSGLSPPDPTGDYTDARSIVVLAALLDRLGVPRATVIGHSIGGRIAWRFAAEHGDRVDGLVLVAPDGFASPGFDYGGAPELPATLGAMRYVLPRFVLQASLAPAYADPTRLTDDLVTRYHALIRGPGVRDAMIERLSQTVLADPVPWLKRIDAPTLLLWGEQDAMVPFANAAEYLAALPRATLAALPGVGHLPHEEAPERSLVELLAFLKRLPG